MNGTSNSNSLNQIFKKDGEGATFAIEQSIFEGQILEHHIGYPNLGYTLKNLGSFHPRAEDVLLLTYPKSGTHWMLEILNMLMRGELRYIEKSSPHMLIDLMCNLDRNAQGDAPKLYWTHMPLSYIPKHVLEKPKLVYGIRNPKSVAVSYHSYMTRKLATNYNGSFAGFLPVFMNGPHSFYSNWFQHVTSYWSALKQYKNTHFVFYEELKNDPLKEVQQLSEFLDLHHDEAFCQEVVNMTTFEQMKKMEKEIKPDFSGVTYKTGQHGLVIQGETDGWKRHFTEEQNERLDSVFHEQLSPFPDLHMRIKFE